MKVKQVMLCDPFTVSPISTLADVSKIFLDFDVNCAPVVGDNGETVGIITMAKVLERLLAGATPEANVGEFMDDPPGVVTENTDFEQIAHTPMMERMLVLDHNNRLTGILSRVELIKKVYRSWEETRNELNVVLQSVSHAIVAFDSAGLVYLLNKGAEVLLGLTSSAAVGQPVEQILPAGEWLDVLNGQSHIGFKMEVNEKRIVANATPIISGREVTGAVVVLQDLSEMENLIMELSRVRELKDELDNIIESSYDGILVVNTAKEVLRVNKSALRFFNVSEFREHGSLSQLKSDIALRLNEMVTEISESGEPLTKLYSKAGGQEIMITGNPRFDFDGQLVQVIFNLRDMTDLQRLKFQITQAKEEKLRYSEELKELRSKLLTEKLVAKSPAMEPVLELMFRVAKVESTVLITGESGVGKEVAAKTIHSLSTRESSPFITVNCGAIPEALLESELFGYEKGAFTGANKEGKIGLMETANGGAIFLDEIGELPLNLQVKLLRAIQDKIIYRVGGIKPIELDIRIIAATNRNLKEMVEKQTFREDLFYRLNVVQIEIPPLRWRQEDIFPLAEHFLQKYSSKYNKAKTIRPEVYRIFERYGWPGNVRELENVIERAVILSEGELIDVSHLPDHFGQIGSAKGEVEIKIREVIPWNKALELMERELLRKALEQGKSIRKTADVLGITHTTVLRKGKQYSLLGS
ncbi:sigma-54-dependent Fis family transcriptional regulator [Paradesulfitobacterium aromaticivorans]